MTHHSKQVTQGSHRAQEQLFDARTSAREKYARLVVGRQGWGALIKHELIVQLSQAWPGAVGLVLRKLLYPKILGSCGRNAVFGQNVVLRHPEKIRLGDNVVIDDNCLIDAKGDSNEGVTIGNGVFIGRNTILSCKNGDLVIGDRSNIGFNCELFSASRVVLGEDTLLAAYCYIIGGDHDFSDLSRPILEQGRASAGVTVGAGSWLGAGAKVLDGVTVGNHAVIGAGAVVRSPVPDYGISVGVPAKVIGSRKNEQC